MLAAYATAPNPSDPLAALEVGDRPDPEAPDGWTTVTVRAASINHHDVWTLRGVGLAEDRYPMILGCDASGVDAEGRDVVVHAVIPSPDWSGDETLDPRRTLLSEKHQGTLAERVVVPTRQRAAEAGGALARGGGLPRHGLADRVPHAVREVRHPGPALPCWSRAPAAASRPR